MKALLLLLGSIIGLPLIAVISFGIQFIIGLGLVASAVSEYDQTHKMLAHSSGRASIWYSNALDVWRWLTQQQREQRARKSPWGVQY